MVIRVSTVDRYLGLSTDTPPPAREGSDFYTLDTGELSIYDGQEWHRQLHSSGVAGEQAELLAQAVDALERVCQQLAIITGIDLTPGESLRG